MHAVIINGSPRVQKHSNTDKILASFLEGLCEQGSTYEQYCISNRRQWDEARKAYIENDLILIALPLYVECIPGLLMEFLETLPAKDGSTRMAFILQSGFAEGVQLRCGEAYLEKLPAMLGCTYAGTLVKGDNFAIRFFEGDQQGKMTVPYQEMGRVFNRDASFFSEECKAFTGPETFSLPVRLLVGLLQKTVARVMFQKIAKGWGCERPLADRPY